MRISDWSSDVCSSDLDRCRRDAPQRAAGAAGQGEDLHLAHRRPGRSVAGARLYAAVTFGVEDRADTFLLLDVYIRPPTRGRAIAYGSCIVHQKPEARRVGKE